MDSSTSVRDAVRTIRGYFGWRGFFRGLTPSILRAFPSNACAYFVYEGVLKGLGAEKVSNLFLTLMLMYSCINTLVDRRGVRD